MHAWLKRAVAGLLSAGTLLGGGLLTAGTANADEIRMPDIGKTITSLTASAATTYPRELVNGGFDYLPAGGWNVISPKLNTSRGKFTSVDPVNGQYIRNAHVTDGNVAWVKWDGFDASKFGWISDQKGGKPQGFVTDHANSVELQRDNDTDNTYAEIVGSEIGKSIYQKIDTQNSTDAVYTVRFDHAALSSEHADGMQALVNGKPVTMTRIGGNKAGDKTGWTGTDIVTHATNTDHYRHDGQWATYEGKVTIPANTPVSTFMFKSLNEAKPDMGNLIDNLTFKIAYRLSYDSNGGTKAKASQISSMTEGKASETDGKVKTVADDAATVANTTNTLPDHLVNGDFEYPVKSDMPVNDGNFWYISQNDGSYFAKGTVLGKRYKLPEGFDKAKFAWHSTQTGDTSYPDLERADDVQVDYKADGTNHYSEISAAQSGATLYQDVATVPGVMYKWSLKHASLDSSHLDKMSVIIGEPGKETAQEATRTTANGHGDKLGKVGTVISTKVSNPEMPAGNKFQEGAHTGQWETYTGTYIATGTVTRFAFHSIEGYSAWDGNLLDDISFSKAYKLTYDKNASDATGKVPSNQRGKENTVQPAKSKTTGSVGLAADKTASGLTVHDLKKNDKGKVPSNSKADSTQPAAFKTPDAKVETIASRAAGDELAVNGGFDTPKWTIAKEGQGLPWVYVTPNKGMIRSYAQAMAGQTGVKAGGLTAATFAWQDLDAIGSIQNFELHREKDGNTAADVHAGRTVAQTVNTTPGASYTFSIRHSGRSKGNAGGVTLLTGPDKDHLTPVKLTRTTVSKTGQKYGDKTGDVGTVAYTHSDSMDATEGSHEPWDHSDDWESYEGTVIIPAGQSRTMIAYRGVAKDGTLTASANDSIIDDLSFRLAYKLSYDANGGAKKSTSQIKASTDGKVKTIAGKTDSLPTELVNGSFDYPAGLIAGVSTKYPWDDWTVVDPINGRYARHIGIDKDPWAPIPGWDASKFAWKSTQTKGTDWQQIAQGVELQKDSKTGNQYAELVAGQAGTAIYQDIATIPGVSYRWTLKHASLDRNHLDGMSVMIGEPGKESAQDARRTTVNGNGDQPGDVGKVISTKVSNDAELNHSSRNHDGQWETYTGTYIATGTVTRFTFKSVSSINNVYGNILDDLSFTKAYRLGYDGNGGTGQVPSRTETGRTETAASGTDGTVRLAADKSAGPESGTIADDRRVLTDTTARQDDGTKQRTITRSDGSVRVETIATTGAVSGCQVYYPAGTRITLATAKADSDCWDSSQIGKTNRTFYGWSANTDANDRDVPVADTMDRNTLNANARTEIVMPARAKTVYALWAINPTLSYNVNTPAGSNAPGTPASQTVPYNTAAADKSGWAAGDTGKIPGYRFDG